MYYYPPPKDEIYGFGVVCLSFRTQPQLGTNGWNFIKLIRNIYMYNHGVVMHAKHKMLVLAEERNTLRSQSSRLGKIFGIATQPYHP